MLPILNVDRPSPYDEGNDQNHLDLRHENNNKIFPGSVLIHGWQRVDYRNLPDGTGALRSQRWTRVYAFVAEGVDFEGQLGEIPYALVIDHEDISQSSVDIRRFQGGQRLERYVYAPGYGRILSVGINNGCRASELTRNLQCSDQIADNNCMPDGEPPPPPTSCDAVYNGIGNAELFNRRQSYRLPAAELEPLFGSYTMVDWWSANSSGIVNLTAQEEPEEEPEAANQYLYLPVLVRE